MQDTSWSSSSFVEFPCACGRGHCCSLDTGIERLYPSDPIAEQSVKCEMPVSSSAGELGIRCERIWKSFGEVVALDGIDLRMPNGLVHSLLGPNGSGKSTLMKVAIGLLKPDSGRALVNGIDPRIDPISVRKIVGYMPEEVVAYDSLNPAEYLSFIASLYEMPRESLEVRSRALSKLLALEEYMSKPIGELSHGNRRKVLLAGSLIHDPSVLILDEPFSGLDPESAKILKEALLDYASRGKTVIISTHVLEIAEAVSKQVVIMQRGRIVAEGPVDSLRSMTGAKDLEEVFIQVTGVSGEIQDLLRALKEL